MERVRTNLSDPEGRFSHAEKDAIEARAVEMFATGGVRTYMKVGAHDVCLERDSASEGTLRAFQMGSTLEQNERLVTRYNKRHKAKTKTIEATP